ncbi:MAG: carboxypeptidase regulatory-like domain-containing protein [Chloroflexota bacterium]
MTKKILNIFSTVALAAASLWFFSGVYAAGSTHNLAQGFPEEMVSSATSLALSNVNEDDLTVNITSPGDVPLNSYKVEMIYERTPGSGTDNMSLGYTGIPFENISNLEVTLENAEGFKAEENKDGDGFRAEGKIAEGGRVILGFNLGMPPCANGATECKYTHNAYAGDSKGNVVVWEDNFIWKAPAGTEGDIDLNIIMIGELKEREIEMTLSRDGGEGQIEGEVRLIIPETPIPAMPSLTEHYKLNAINGQIGDAVIDGRFIIWPVRMDPDAKLSFIMPVVIDPDKCEDPECKDFLMARFTSDDAETVETSTEFKYSKETASSSENPNIWVVMEAEVVDAGQNVPIEFGIFDPAATGDQAGKYGFLLEVSGLKPTGKTQSEFTEAGPDKITFSESANGLRWEGEVGEGGKIRVNTLFVADNCANGSSCSAGAKLTVILPNGTEMVVKDTILIEDKSGFDPDLVKFKAAILPTGETIPQSADDFDKLPFEAACGLECQNILLGIKNNNADKAETFITITFPDYLKLGPPDGYKLYKVKDNKDEGTQTAQIRVLAGDKLQLLSLTAQIDGVLEDDTSLPIEFDFCAQAVGSNQCTTDPEEEETRSADNIFILYLIWRMRDFGDAPTNQNHFGVTMDSYPGEIVNPVAKFPMARDTSILSLPPNQIKGPAHRLSPLFHLGSGVTPEFAIDRNWDADFYNNIEPSLGTDQFDLDLYDDGVDITQISFSDCGVTTIPVEVTITPEIVTWYENRDDDGLAYINIWLDTDRSGQWGYDSLTLCQPSAPSEHIVVDAVVDPVALGAGTHTVMVTTGTVGWSNILGVDEMPAWMRVMLTPVPSNKDLYVIYGDGRGEDFVYYAGETEDYYYVPGNVLSSSSSPFTADMTLDVDLLKPGTNAKEDQLEFPGIKDVDGEMRIRFRNDGYKAAEDIEIIIDLPETILKYADFSRLFCDGCSTETSLEEGIIKVDTLEPQEFGEIVVGWIGCLTCTRAIEEAEIIGSIRLNTKFDFRPFNNFFEFKSWPPTKILEPFPGLGWSGCLTCVRTVEDAQLIPDAYNFLLETNDPDVTHYRMYRDGEQVGDDMEMCDGIPCKDLGFNSLDFVIANGGGLGFTFVGKNGKESPQSEPIELSCVNDLVRGSLIFIDEETGKQRRVSPEFFGLDPAAFALDPVKFGLDPLMLFPSRNYKAVVMYCGDDPAPKLSLKIGDKDFTFTPLKEGDVIYETSFLLEIDGKRAASSIVLEVESNGTTFENSFATEEPTSGMVKDSATGSAISGAEILIMSEQSAVFGDETVSVFAPWSGANGQSNPVSTGSDGSYDIDVPNGTYQIAVIADGYQDYRSAEIEVTDGRITTTVNMIEARPAPSNINIGIGDSGFEQTVIVVEAGWVVKFINTGSDQHGAESAEIGEFSGLMAPGASFKMAFPEAGTFEITDPANGNALLVVQVTGSSSSNSTIFLPMIIR